MGTNENFSALREPKHNTVVGLPRSPPQTFQQSLGNVISLNSEFKLISAQEEEIGPSRLRALPIGAEFQKVGILGSRIPDIISEKSGHFRLRPEI